MAEGKRVTASDLELNAGGEVVPAATLKEARENIEREMVELTLKRHGGRISSAAAELGISRPTLYELMDKLGISRGDPTVQNSDRAQKTAARDAQQT